MQKQCMERAAHAHVSVGNNRHCAACEKFSSICAFGPCSQSFSHIKLDLTIIFAIIRFLWQHRTIIETVFFLLVPSLLRYKIAKKCFSDGKRLVGSSERYTLNRSPPPGKHFFFLQIHIWVLLPLSQSHCAIVYTFRDSARLPWSNTQLEVDGK